MSIRVLMHHTPNWRDIAAITTANYYEYCERHGYVFTSKEVPQYSKYTGLEKLQMLSENMESGDVAMVVDADTIITNMRIRIQDFLDHEHEFYICEGLNCGVFIIRKTYGSDWLLHYIEDKILNGGCHCEQDAVQAYVKEFPHELISKKFKILPHPAFNSYLSEYYPDVPQPRTEAQGQWVEGSFLLHVPALGMQQRLEILKNVKITK